MKYTEPKNIHELAHILQETVSLADNDFISKRSGASRIVSATFGNWTLNFDELSDTYPALENIANQAADIETQQEVDARQWRKLVKITSEFIKKNPKLL